MNLYILLAISFTVYLFGGELRAKDAYYFQIKRIQGEKAWLKEQQKKIPLKEGRMILENQVIETGKDTHVAILVNGESSIHIGPYTSSKILAPKQEKGFWQWSFSLITGSLRLVVKRLTGDKTTIKAKLNTEAGIIGVRGTDFGVLHNKNTSKTEVYVFQGQVYLAEKGKSFFSIDSVLLKEGLSSFIVKGGKPANPNKFNLNEKEKIFLKLDIPEKRIFMDKNKPLALTKSTKAKVNNKQKTKKNMQDSLNKQLFKAIEKGEIEKVLPLKVKGANINAKNEKKETPIMIALKAKDSKMISYLLVLSKPKVNLNAKDNSGNTVIMTARTLKHVKQLLEKGADPNIRNKDGLNAKEYFLQKGQSKIAEFIKIKN